MSGPDKPTVRPKLPLEPSEYEVGYAKPPLSTRFRRGQSGNPSGRPKGSTKKSAALPALNDERLKTIILEEAYRSISLNDPNGQVDIPMARPSFDRWPSTPPRVINVRNACLPNC